MNSYLVQVTLGQHFADLEVIAADDAGAIAASRALVKTDASLAMFRHRFANFII